MAELSGSHATVNFTMRLVSSQGERGASENRGRLQTALPPALLAALLAIGVAGAAGQAPVPIDTSAIGPQVGAAVPAFAGTDQFGKTHTLQSVLRAKGAMLVFFRSADW